MHNQEIEKIQEITKDMTNLSPVLISYENFIKKEDPENLEILTEEKNQAKLKEAR